MRSASLSGPRHRPLAESPFGRHSGSRSLPPNIIIIQADDLGYGDLSAYGQAQFQTPSLDRLAREGMRFTQYYAGSTVCAPSRTALMTGLHTGHAWIRGNGELPLRPEDVTVAMVLRDAGYRTAVIGKWGLGRAGHRPASRTRRDSTTRSASSTTGTRTGSSPIICIGTASASRPTSTRTTSTTCSRRSRWRSSRRADPRPFFLYLNYTVPHAELRVPEDSLEPFARQVSRRRRSSTPTADGRADRRRRAPSLGYRSQPTPQAAFAAMITRMDRDIGAICRSRCARAAWTAARWCMFISDNGPHQEGGGDPAFFKSSGGLRGIKRDLYEGGIRVPMIARWPGTVPGRPRQRPVLGALGHVPDAGRARAARRRPPGSTACRWRARCAAQPQPTHDFLYWEFHERGFQQAVRMGDWKAVRLAKDAPLELYDLADRSARTANVAAAHPDVVKKIETYLKTARTDNPNWPVK